MGDYPQTSLKGFQTPVLLPFTRHKQNTLLLLSNSKRSSKTNDKFSNKLLLNTICLPSLILLIRKSVLFTLLFLPKAYYHKLKGEITLREPLIKRGLHFIAFFLCDRHCYPSLFLSASPKTQSKQVGMMVFYQIYMKFAPFIHWQNAALHNAINNCFIHQGPTWHWPSHCSFYHCAIITNYNFLTSVFI